MIKNNVNLNETFVSAFKNHTQNKPEKAEVLYKQALKEKTKLKVLSVTLARS